MTIVNPEALARIRRFLKKSDAQAILVSAPANVRYLSGFTNEECWLLITPGENFFIADFRYQYQAQQEVTGYSFVIFKGSLTAAIADLAHKQHLEKIFFEGESLTFARYKALQQALGPAVKFEPVPPLLAELRMCKQEHELACIRTAIKITQRGLTVIAPCLKPGVTEREIKNQLEHVLMREGAEGMAFETIVASGPNAAMPHAKTSQRAIAENEPIIIDVGVVYKGYKSDLTRTFFSGRMSPYVKYYKLVAAAQDSAIKLVRPGVAVKTLDRAARNVLAQNDLAQYFGHALGHGVGLEVHELPVVSGKNPQRLKAGMVVTIEPGIYIADSGGIRIEDMVLVTPKGHEVLSR